MKYHVAFVINYRTRFPEFLEANIDSPFKISSPEVEEGVRKALAKKKKVDEGQIAIMGWQQYETEE